MANDDLTQRLTLYTIIFDKFNQEGDGIWSRFNIMIGINLALYAAFGFVYLSDKKLWELAVSICIGGLLQSIWSIYVVSRLWTWHERWRLILQKIEESFPDRSDWIKPHGNLPSNLEVDPFQSQEKSVWLSCLKPYYTHVLLWLIIAGWLMLAAMLIRDRYAPRPVPHSLESVSKGSSGFWI
jgi:hypothetical protein